MQLSRPQGVDIKKFVKIGRPGYRVTKQRDADNGQQSLLFEVRDVFNFIYQSNLSRSTILRLGRESVPGIASCPPMSRR